MLRAITTLTTTPTAAFQRSVPMTLAKVIGTDLWKAAVGVVVSVVIALSIQPLAQLTAG